MFFQLIFCFLIKNSKSFGGVVNFDDPKCVFFLRLEGNYTSLGLPKKGMDGGFGLNPWFGGFGGCQILRPRSGEKLGEAELVQ